MAYSTAGVEKAVDVFSEFGVIGWFFLLHGGANIGRYLFSLILKRVVNSGISLFFSNAISHIPLSFF